MTEDSLEERATAHIFANNSSKRRFLYIGFYTFLLNIITLTIFRFWGRTQFRRQLWSDTTINGESLEYTGRGIELFLGFIIAIFTISIPAATIVLILQTALGEVGLIIAIAILYVALFCLVGVATFLVRRYIMSRTRYRGVRFEQRGSALGYGFRVFGYMLGSVLTLGWLVPLMQLRLSRYLWDHAYYGSEKIHFEQTAAAQGEHVYKRFAIVWVLSFAYYIATLALLTFLQNAGGAGDQFLPSILFLVLVAAGLVAFAWYQAAMTRRIVKSLRIAGASGDCDLSARALIRVYLLGSLLTIATLGIGGLALKMMTWRVVANHIRFKGEIDFAAIEQAASTGPAQGEGIADGLDIGSGF